MLVGTREFRGMNQLQDAWSLPPQVAEFCANIDVSSGAFEPLRGIAPGPRGGSLVSGDVETIFWKNGWRTLATDARVLMHPDTDRVLWASASTETRQATEAMLDSGEFRAFGVPAPSTAPTVAATGPCGEDLLRSTSYVYTLVTDMGEESGFSPPSTVVDLYVGQSAQVSGFSLSVPANTVGQYVRVYRAETDNYGEAMFQFVAELPWSATSWADSDATAGDAGVMRNWLHPPAASSMAIMNNGMLGLIQSGGREVSLSEPGYPYAFPDANRLKVPFDAMQVAAVGASLVVLTTERPCLVYASTPESASITPLPVSVAPLSDSPRAVCASQMGVVFPSHDGLVAISEGGAVSVVTQSLLSRDDWQRFAPASLRVAVHNDKIYMLAKGVGSAVQGAVYDAVNGQLVALRDVAHAIHDLYVDYAADALYLLYSQMGDSQRRIGQLHADAGSTMTGTWRSGPRRLDALTTFSVLRIRGDFSGGKTVSVTILRDGLPFYTVQATRSGLYRLPAGLYQSIQYELNGTATVRSIEIASSVEELA